MTSQTAPATRIVTFRLGTDLFAADIIVVERVLKYEAPRAVPNLPSWIEGVFEYQGRAIPVVDLRARFGLSPSSAGPHTRMLVLSTAGEWVAVIVDAVLDVRPIEEGDVQPPPALFRGLAGEYLRGLTRRDDDLVLLLDVDRLLQSDERLTLQALSGTSGHA
jgi:purine-binding chemotaxis protein CheW